MPFHFKPIKDVSEFAVHKSALIVPCRFCPAASAAVRTQTPYIELFRNFLKTESYEKQIENLKSELINRGVRVGIFKSKWIHQFVLCMWTSRRRKALARYAREYDALIVLGCEAAVRTVNDSVKSTHCRILQGIETEGVMSIMPRVKLPCTLSLELESLTPLGCLER
jgi:hypothetical protein